jgi:hypothetical protein
MYGFLKTMAKLETPEDVLIKRFTVCPYFSILESSFQYKSYNNFKTFLQQSEGIPSISTIKLLPLSDLPERKKDLIRQNRNNN